MQTQVLIAGAGPVGLTLAIDLGKRGVRCTLIEKNAAPLGYPKMERCNPRTMEIFRRLGIVEQVRAAGYPEDWPMDIYLIFDLMRPPLWKMSHPSVAEAKAKRDRTNDGSMPLEPYQIISQYTLEPLLKSIVEGMPNVEVRFGHELQSFEEIDGGVRAHVRKLDGSHLAMDGEYLVGCDGASSVVRRQLDFKMEGEPHIRELRQALFHCPGLYEKVPAPPARHYHRIDDHWTLFIVQDSRKHFSIHAMVESDEAMARLFEATVGAPIAYEMLYCAKWTQRLLLAEHYSRGRVFLAGDACHLVIPTGGLGMNTGVGDAVDLSWKLAATLSGWGGPRLLASYEAERRPVGLQNIKASGQGAGGRAIWRAAYRPGIDANTPEAKAALARLLELAKVEAPKTMGVVGAELGYRYADSPIVFDEPGGPEPNHAEYIPTSWPGARLPHLWIEPGRLSVHDRIGDDRFTLLCLENIPEQARAFTCAFAARRVPFAVISVDAPAARRVYGFPYLLIRPDLHVAWRGRALPPQADEIAARVSGQAAR